MARKATITKEVILDAALKMLIRDGYSEVNIKTLSAEIGCSTQPLVWHFENMDGLRNELAKYAREYAQNKISSLASECPDPFERIGRAYVKMAIEEPNLFKYLYLGESPLEYPYSIDEIAKDKKNQELVRAVAEDLELTKDQTIRCIQNTVIYTHGIATLVATGIFTGTEEELMDRVKYVLRGLVNQEKRQ